MFSTGQRQMPHSENESIAFLPSVLLFESVHFVCVAPATATCASPSHPIRPARERVRLCVLEQRPAARGSATQ